jgi:hypothetical protein
VRRFEIVVSGGAFAETMLMKTETVDPPPPAVRKERSEMRSSPKRRLLPCFGIALLAISLATPAGAVGRRDRGIEAPRARDTARDATREPAVAAPPSAGTLLLAVWTLLSDVGLVPPPPPPTDPVSTFTDNSDQGGTMDPNGL